MFVTCTRISVFDSLVRKELKSKYNAGNPVLWFRVDSVLKLHVPPQSTKIQRMIGHLSLRNIGLATLVVAVYFVLKALRIFLFPRKGALVEQYPFESTIKLFQAQGYLLDLCYQYFTSEYKRTGKKTFILEVIGLPAFIMTTDVANVTHVLKTNYENYGKAHPMFKDKFQGLLGDGIFNADGQQWFAHRKTSAHLFKLSEFKSTVLDVFNDDLTTVIDYIKSKGQDSFDLHSLMHKFTLDSIAQIAFGMNLGCISDNEVQFANDFDYCTACINDSMVNPFWLFERFCTYNGWKYFCCLWRLNRFASKLIKERRAQVAAAPAGARSDLLTLYLNRDNFSAKGAEEDDDGANKKAGGYSDAFMEPTDQNLRDVILNMVIAGRDTTAQALSWTFYRLCIHPEVQVKVREEVRAAEGKMGAEARNSKGGYTYAFLQQLRYTEAVCNEALRLHPSVPKEGKCVMKGETLPDGTEVKRGDVLSFMPYCMGRDPDLWGPNCLEFVPERFLSMAKPNPFVFTAFQVRALLRLCCFTTLVSLHDTRMMSVS
jgi:cytochrome P450